jgi:hypothetical protein
MKLIYNRTNENYHVTAWHCWCKQTDKEFYQIILWNLYGDAVVVKTVFEGNLQFIMQEARLMLAGVWQA